MEDRLSTAGPLHLVAATPPSDAVRAWVRQGLMAFNRRHTASGAAARGLEIEMNPLERVLIAPDGTTWGGLLGYTQWGWLHVQTLWLDERCRGQGYGRALLHAVEAEAIRRGCLHSRLSTYSFQARGFYERQGYQVWGHLDDYPPGYTSYAMRKDLQGDPQS